MMTKEKAKALYEGKYFYEIVKIKAGRMAGTIQLFGPFDNILYVTSNDGGFMQVINGKAVAFFKKDEILVTDRIL